MSRSRTECSDTCEAQTRNPSVSGQALYTALLYNSSFDKGQSAQMHSLARIFSANTHKVVNIDEDFDHVPGLANNFWSGC